MSTTILSFLITFCLLKKIGNVVRSKSVHRIAELAADVNVLAFVDHALKLILADAEDGACNALTAAFAAIAYLILATM